MFMYPVLNFVFEQFWWEFLAVQWLGVSTFIAGAQVPSLVRKLRSRKLWDFQLILFHDHLYLFHLSPFGFHNFKTFFDSPTYHFQILLLFAFLMEIIIFTFLHWRRKWQPTPVFLPGESQGRGSPVGCRLWGRTESDTTEVT